jgi:hypothetical protein
MNLAIEMGSGAFILIPSFIKIVSTTENLIGGEHLQTDTQNHIDSKVIL